MVFSVNASAAIWIYEQVRVYYEAVDTNQYHG